MRLKKSHLINILKVIVVGFIFAFLFRSNHFQLTNLLKALDQFHYLFYLALCFIAALILTAFRWKLLLNSFGFFQPFRNVLKLNLMGSFFSSFLPGSVSGDLIKGYYLVSQTAEKNRKYLAALSILLDRVVGFLAELILVVVSFFIVRNWIELPSTMQWIGFMFLLVLSVILVFIVLVLGLSIKNISRLLSFFWKNKVSVESLIRKISMARDRFPILLRCIALSLVSHGITALMFYWGLKAMDPTSTLPFYVLLIVVPLGLFAMSVPVSPGGLGVGETAFLVLLQWVEPSVTTSGAEWCFLVRSVMLLISFIAGGFVYVRFNKKILNIENSPTLLETA